MVISRRRRECVISERGLSIVGGDGDLRFKK